MPLLDQFTQIAGNLFGTKEGGQDSPVLKFVVQMLSSSSLQGQGGLGGLLQNFQQKGLGDIVSSWVGTGENQPISPEQIQQGLGGDTLQKLAAQSGMSVGQASSHLASALPHLIDKLTPGGEMPDGGALDEVLSVLQSKFQ